MAKHRRAQHEREPPRGAGHRLAAWLRWPVSLLVVATMAASALLKLYVWVKALLSGVYTSGARFGSPQVYLLDADPGRYWFWMAWDGFFTVLLLLLAVAIAWVFLVLDKPK
ncbi:hypothetical protein OCJ37_18270 [Xanthomonas sp. AM6]|uniref:hypothetical protein n=1 Tax=Xanthomonas sp. AM6 TaxID=2982531 RepID=UPI0021DB0DA0|nr:hypothetical protein [Xanthomonas sp. AM6]UYB51895.1 hypothetical protein OCJ37_18270 [Xanthomonas sp. AM6]